MSSQHSILSLFTSTTIINENGYTNVTIDQMRPTWASSLVLSNTILFLILFTVYMFILIGFIIKVTRKLKLKRNQKILFIMTGIYVTVQIMSLLIRVVNETLILSVRLKVESGELIEWKLFVTMQVFAGLNTFSMLSNFLTLFSIIVFVQNMFWSTATLMRAISKQTSKIIRTLMAVVGTVFVAVACVIITLIGIIAGIRRFDYIPKEYVMAIQVTSFVVGGIVLLFVGGMLIASGIIVIRTIQHTSKNVTGTIVSIKNTDTQKSESNVESQTSHSSNTRQSFDKVSFEKRVQSPFKITFGLLVGLLLCITLQLVAIAIASGATELANYSFIWQFLNCTGVLVFGILILFLFYPLFRDMELAMQEIEKRKETLSQKKLRSHHHHLQVPSSTSMKNQDLSLSGSGDNFLSLPSSSAGDMSPTSPSAISFSSSEVLELPDEIKLYQ